jgi:thymidine kinase
MLGLTLFGVGEILPGDNQGKIYSGLQNKDKVDWKMSTNILDDLEALEKMVDRINFLERSMKLLRSRGALEIRKPKKLVERKEGKWVACRQADQNKFFTAVELVDELAYLEDRAVEHAAQVADTQRMDNLNARVKALLGDEDFEFYTKTLIGYGMPRA